MRKMWSKSSKRRSVSNISKYGNNEDQRSFADVGEANTSSNHVRDLIDPEYDTKTVKHAWVNGILNVSSSNDFNESSLRLYRVELRGCHLYVYRAPASMNVKRLKPDEQTQDSGGVSVNDNDMGSVAHSGPSPGSNTKVGSSMGQYNSARSLSTLDSDNFFASNGFGGQGMIAKRFEAPSSSIGDETVVFSDHISYFSDTIPHPELKLDSGLNALNSESSLEALVHFFIFANDPKHVKSLTQLKIIFPLLPKFGSILKLVYIFLRAIQCGEFEGYTSIKVSNERALHLLQHIDEYFSGFLLKSDVAPFIPKILQCMCDESQLTVISNLQESIISHQSKLLSLITKVDAEVAQSSSENILTELSTHRFMHNIDLLDLVAVICEIDRSFFTSWNSSLDMSLLLHTLACDENPTDSFYKKNSLVFQNTSHLHYLARLFSHHLFVENEKFGSEYLARIIERWIDLACLLDKCGNMSSWYAIASVVLSSPVLRLRTVWSNVGDDYIALLRNDWSPVLFELDQSHLASNDLAESEGGISDGIHAPDALKSKHPFHIMAPRGMGKIYSKNQAIPYFGDLSINNTKYFNFGDLQNVWQNVCYAFDSWNEYFTRISDSDDIISYNQSVLEHYAANNMLLSNESLNQVFHLGVNRDGSKNESSLPRPTTNYIARTLSRDGHFNASELRNMLFRLLDFNTDSVNLQDLMKLSLKLEPSLSECHIKRQSSDNVMNLPDTSSYETIDSCAIQSSSHNDDPDASRLFSTPSIQDAPIFNLEYHKIDFLKFDDLLLTNKQDTTGIIEAHNVMVDDQLVLGIDDFMSDPDTLRPRIHYPGDLGRLITDDEGLGIDVNEIMASGRPSDANNNNISNKTHKTSDLRVDSSHLRQLDHSITAKYIPRLATIEKLIDLLLIDSSYIDESHPIDAKEFRLVFMLNYSSFISTKTLLEQLLHRFIHSGNAVISIMQKQYLQKQGVFDSSTSGAFPRWSSDNSIDLSKLGEVDYTLLIQIQSNILGILQIILNDFHDSFHNDLANKNIVINMLKLYSNEILQWYNSHKITDHLLEPFQALVDSYTQVKRAYIRRTYIPTEQSQFERFLFREFKLSRSIRQVPINRNLPSHYNIHKVEKFLIKFNKLLAIFYQGITPKDWFAAYKVLEDQFVNHSLFYCEFQKSSTPENLLRITDVFSYLESLYDTDGKIRTLDKFPLVFQKLFQVHHKFKAYLLIQLCDQNIIPDERLERMKTILVMMQISRLKMKDFRFDFSGDQDVIPSSIETALVGAIYSPESRVFEDLWIQASIKLNLDNVYMGQNIDGVDSLLPRYITHDRLSTGNEPLLPCFGWIMQNLIKLVQFSSFHRSAINFNKRYILYKLIKAVNVDEFKNEDHHKYKKDFEFLFNLDETQIGHMGFEISVRKHSTDLFSNVVRRQSIINLSQNVKNNSRDIRGPTDSDSTHTVSNYSGSNYKRQSLIYKTSSSSRFKISGLFNKSRSLGHLNANERAVTYKELPNPTSVADPRQKPLLSIQLKDKKIFPVYLLQYCFKVDTNNAAGTHFFQASNEEDSRDWLRCLNFANRHWYMSKLTNMKSDHSHTTFGLPLTTICARDGAESPLVLTRIYEAIEKDSLEEVGIYRISTSQSELNWIKQEINRTGTIDLGGRNIDVHTLTSCVKSFFRELPDALLTDPVIEMLYPSKRLDNEASNFNSEEASAYQKALSYLPNVHYCTLKNLVKHLSVVVEKNHANKMTCSNLATVIGPALTEASNLGSLINNIGAINCVLEKLIENYCIIFEQDVATIDKAII